MSNHKSTIMRQFLTIVAAMVFGVAFGQKPNINKAKAAYDKGELADAKTIIDQATTYEKTKDKAKTWFYRGDIYMTLDTLNSEPGAMETAMESYNKALELDPEQKTLTTFTGVGIENVDSRIQNYFGYYYNAAVQDYQNESFSSAADNFEKAAFIMQDDTSAMMNAGYAAAAAEDDDRARVLYEKSIERGVKDKNMYLRLYNYAVGDEDYDRAMTIIRNAREVHPSDVDLQKFEINLLIEQDKIDEAKSGIQDAISKEPNNADLHFSLGVINEELGDVDAARSSYESAIEIDANHYNSNFNLGVVVFNECNELIKQRNALGYKEQKKFDELTVQIEDRLKVALPYWEKLYSLKSEETTILETLEYIYTGLDMKDKASEITEKLNNLK